MAFPVHDVTLPADLTNADNGKLTDDQLVLVAFPGKGNGRLHRQTARAWEAMSTWCLRETGVTLTITSVADAYRTYEQQKQAFLQRYTTTPIAGTSSKVWNGQRYYLKLGYAMSATPGASNHGLGLALDVCEYRLGTIVSISRSPAWPWLLAYAHEFGFSWEAQSEPWHLRLFCGDTPGSSTLLYEGGALNPAPPAPSPPAPPVPEPLPPAPPIDPYDGWPETPKTVIRVGSTGDQVKYMQAVLRDKLGYVIGVDGQFGKQTEGFVIWFQTTYGLVADGIVGKNTWAKIDMIARS
jgi:D-alanyl-D-alanine carboxypeptidase/Putative peptidoglycan binding domain